MKWFENKQVMKHSRLFRYHIEQSIQFVILLQMRLVSFSLLEKTFNMFK